MKNSSRFHSLSKEAKALSNFSCGSVIVHDKNIEKALRMLRQYSYSKIEDAKERQTYIKPTTKRRIVLNKARGVQAYISNSEK